jgi:AcrR family transcriptional regulator
MAIARLDSEERRRGIVAAALPLFARKGFAGTTTKEIAEAAGVSEALVFKHFPSKAVLYEEILKEGCSADTAFEQLCTLVPSTSTLVHMTHFLMRHFVLDGAAGGEEEHRHRLMLNSYAEDGDFARLVFENVFADIYPMFRACLAAAEAAGDVAPIGIAPENKFWFAQHVAAMIAYTRLPKRPALAHQGDPDAIVEDAVRFILRAVGLKDEAIAAHYNPKAFAILGERPTRTEPAGHVAGRGG